MMVVISFALMSSTNPPDRTRLDPRETPGTAKSSTSSLRCRGSEIIVRNPFVTNR